MIIIARALAGDPKGPLARVPSLSEDLVKSIDEGIWWGFHKQLLGVRSVVHLCTVYAAGSDSPHAMCKVITANVRARLA